MKHLTPTIASFSKQSSKKSLIKRGVSCGIFQELGDNSSDSNCEDKKVADARNPYRNKQ